MAYKSESIDRAKAMQRKSKLLSKPQPKLFFFPFVHVSVGVEQHISFLSIKILKRYKLEKFAMTVNFAF